MVTKDLQILNLKFDHVMFNSLVLTWERNFEVTFSIFSVLVFQINVFWTLFRYLSVLKLVTIKNVKIVIIYAFKSKSYKYFVFTKNTPQICLILHQFNLYVSLICGNKIGDNTKRHFKISFPRENEAVKHD